MNNPTRELLLNLLPPKRLICEINLWNSQITEDNNLLMWNKFHGFKLNKLEDNDLDYFFSYYVLAIANYKQSSMINVHCVSLDKLVGIWFDKYYIDRRCFFKLKDKRSKKKFIKL